MRIAEGTIVAAAGVSVRRVRGRTGRVCHRALSDFRVCSKTVGLCVAV